MLEAVHPDVSQCFVETEYRVGGVVGSVQLQMVHAAMVTEVVRTLVHNRRASHDVKCPASELVEELVIGGRHMVPVVLDIDAHLRAEEAVRDGPENRMHGNEFVHAKEVEEEDEKCLRPEQPVRSALLVGDLGLHTLLDS